MGTIIVLFVLILLFAFALKSVLKNKNSCDKCNSCGCETKFKKDKK